MFAENNRVMRVSPKNLPPPELPRGAAPGSCVNDEDDFWNGLKDLIQPEGEKPLEFDVKMKRLTPEIIDLAYAEAIRRLDNQQNSMAKAQQQIQTFLGWYLAAIISLIGILTGQMIDDSGSSFVILMSFYGIIVLGTASFCFWSSLQDGIPTVRRRTRTFPFR